MDKELNQKRQENKERDMIIGLLVVVILLGGMAVSAVLGTFHYECLINIPSVDMQNKLLKGNKTLEISDVSLQDTNIGCIKKMRFDIKQHFDSGGTSIMYQQIIEYLSSCEAKLVEGTLRQY